MYNKQWAYEVVCDFWYEHTNNCDDIYRMYHIDMAMAVKWLMDNDGKWDKYKRLVKYYEKNVESFREQFDTTEEFRRRYYTFAKYCKVMMSRIAYPCEGDILDKQFYFDYS